MKMTYKQKRAFINVRRRWAKILDVETAKTVVLPSPVNTSESIFELVSTTLNEPIVLASTTELLAGAEVSVS